MKSLGIEINHQKIFIISLILHLGNYGCRIIEPLVIGSIILSFDINLFDIEQINQTLSMRADMMEGFLISLNISSYMNYVIFYIVVLFATYSRMAAINKCLRKQTFLVNSNTLEHCEIVRMMAILHDKVCSTAKLINVCFALNLINYLIYFVFFVILFSFGIYHYLDTPNAPIKQLFINFITLQWILYYAIGLVWIILIASWIKSEGKMTVKLFHQLTISNNDVKLLKTIQLSTMQIKHRQPEISAGLFKIDLELTALIIGAVFSYTIILVQFNSS